MTELTITPATGRWIVRAGGAELGESSDVLELEEGGMPPVRYLPLKDLAMAFLERSEQTSSCPMKGEARFYDIVTRSRTMPNAAWVYEAPSDAAAELKEHIAFYPEFATVEEV